MQIVFAFKKSKGNRNKVHCCAVFERNHVPGNINNLDEVFFFFNYYKCGLLFSSFTEIQI